MTLLKIGRMIKDKGLGIYFQFLCLSVGREPHYLSSPKRYSRFNKESNLNQNWSAREMIINFIRLQNAAHCMTSVLPVY